MRFRFLFDVYFGVFRMSDRNKESSPPPLLLMGATEGLTLTPATGASLLMPVPHTDSSLMTADEGGEEDSFLGQAPTQPAMSYFQPSAGPATTDPFAQVGQNPIPAVSSAFGQPLSAPPSSSTPPPRDGSPNPQKGEGDNVADAADPPPRAPVNAFQRQGGPHMRYAQPPPGVYAPPPGQVPAPSTLPSFSSSPLAPPTTAAPPPGPPTFRAAPPMGPPPTSMNAPHTSSSSFAPPPFGAPPPSSSSSFDMGSPSSSITPPQLGSPGTMPYVPVSYHWFYCTRCELRQIWHPFSIADTIKLEDAYRAGHQDNVVASVQGGRYDVDIIERTRNAIYWDEPATKVRRCSWFFKPEGETRFVPYEEEFAQKLEDEYKNTLATNAWHKKLEFPGGETIVMHNPNVIVHFRASAQPDEWGTTQVIEQALSQAQTDALRPKVVKRGVDETFENIESGEPQQIDHVVFFVHGIGPTCDLRFRNLTECVDDFRRVCGGLLQSHFRAPQEEGRIGRIEFLPVKWHAALHGDATGVDRKLKSITLPSIGKLRHFTNDTLLDILFYASPTYAQQIADTVAGEINRLYKLFLHRNPVFKGQASVAGHSLGSLILFDLLSHQKDPNAPKEEEPAPTSIPANASSQSLSTLSGTATPTLEEQNGDVVQEEKDPELTLEDLLAKLGLQDFAEAFQKEQIDMEALAMCEDSDIKEMGIPMGPRKKLQGYVKELKQKQVRRERAAEVQRQQQQEAQQRHLVEEAHKAAAEEAAKDVQQHDPLLRSVSNTSIAFMSAGQGTGVPFVTYPQLDFSPANFFALGSPIAMFLTVRGVECLGEDFKFPTCNGFFNIFHPFDPVAYRLEPLITNHYPPKAVQIAHHKGRKRLHLELKESISRMGTDIKQKVIESVKYTWKALNDFAMAHKTAPPQEMVQEEMDSMISQMVDQQGADNNDETMSLASSAQEEEIPIGCLNGNRRLDYVLQEAPIESFNDYLFALGSHLCYWESEDTALMLLREMYSMMNIRPQKPGSYPPAFGAPPTGAPPMFAPPPRTSSSTLPMAPPPSSSSAPPPMFMAPPTMGPPTTSSAPPLGPPPPMGPPPTGFAPPPPSGAGLPRGHPTSRPKRVVDQSIYGGGAPTSQAPPPSTFMGPPPPVQGFTRPQ